MTQHAEPHHDPRRDTGDDDWTPPELPDQITLDPDQQQPDPERADWMPPPEHRPPSLLTDPGGTYPDGVSGGAYPADRAGATDVADHAEDTYTSSYNADDPAPRIDPTATMLPPASPVDPASARTPPGESTIGAGRPVGEALAMPPVTGGPADPDAAPTPTPAGIPASRPNPVDPLWPDAELARFEGRWREVQLGFVDDPRHAAAEARSLLDEAVERLTQAIADRRRELDTWADARAGNGGSSAAGAATEDMLTAVRRYRGLLDQLLAVGAPQ